MNKRYWTRTQEDFNSLMEEFEKKQYRWQSGRNPLEMEHLWETYGKDTCVEVREVDCGRVLISYESVAYLHTQDFEELEVHNANTIYLVDTQEDFNNLMYELEKEGRIWSSGEAPTSLKLFWTYFKENTFIRLEPFKEGNKIITMGDRCNLSTEEKLNSLVYKAPQEEEPKPRETTIDDTKEPYEEDLNVIKEFADKLEKFLKSDPSAVEVYKQIPTKDAIDFLSLGKAKAKDIYIKKKTGLVSIANQQIAIKNLHKVELFYRTYLVEEASNE